jgi:hypothetical protein
MAHGRVGKAIATAVDKKESGLRAAAKKSGKSGGLRIG